MVKKEIIESYEKNDRSVLIDMVKTHGIEITHIMGHP